MTRLAAALLICCLFSASAAAADVRIGETPIALPSLPGHCEMDVVHASDAPLIAKLHASVQKSGHRLLLLSADCKELKQWRDGKRPAITHMAEYQTVLAFERARLPDEPEKIIKAFCDQMDAMANEPTAASMAVIQDRGEKAVKLIRMNEIKFLGAAPVPDEPMVCYAATMHKFTVEAGDEYAFPVADVSLRNMERIAAGFVDRLDLTSSAACCDVAAKASCQRFLCCPSRTLAWAYAGRGLAGG